ncbi:hypothetical protein SeMB42_g04202 [Synchytrium endobioticum]|uniref:Uncharacterized protein n=1 Tax=Synchytrium endobioticum TaxID=286115 RepID=A0A507D002_9FUNG|nr:hypothetical protein SeMB42_g04202 [Synchytrium endobioticum]
MVLQRVLLIACGASSNAARLVIASGKHFIVLDTSTAKAVAGPPDIDKTHTDHVSSTSYISIPDASFPNADIIDMACNARGTLMACCAEDKSITVWSTDSWIRTCKRTALKRLSVCIFSPDSSCVLAGDKFGDMYRFSLSADEAKPTLLGGHVSMLTDMILSPSNEYLISADRDEKIRVHHYPNTYNLEQFCLGHKHFVSNITIPSFAPNLLLSGGGDDELFVWDYHTVSVSAFHVNEANKEIAVLLEGRPCIIVIDASEMSSRLIIKRVILTINETAQYVPYDAVYDTGGKLWTVGYTHPISDMTRLENACRVYDTNSDGPPDNILNWWQSSANAPSFDMFALGKLRKKWFEERNKMQDNNDFGNGGGQTSATGDESKKQNKKGGRGGDMSRPPYARHNK